MHCEGKIKDTFPTTYAHDYVWRDSQQEPDLSSKFDAFALTEEGKKAFIDVNAIKDLPWEEQLLIITNLYAQRMKTTYYVSYCETAKGKLPKEDENATEDDTLLNVADKLYGQKTVKTLEPISTSRRVLGYCRPAYYYTALSEYQDEYSRSGYQRLIPNRSGRLKQRLPFCDQFKS